MAAADIFRALGAALQTGVGTYGALDEQEKAQKLREEQLKQQQLRDQHSMQIDREQLEGQQQDRKMRVLLAAIEGTSPGEAVSPELFKQAQELGLQDRFKTIEAGTAMPTAGGSFAPAVLPQLQETYLRKPTLDERGTMQEMRARQDAQDDRNIFQTWMQNEGASADYDTRVAKAAATGQQAPGMTLKEKRAEADRDRAADHRNRMSELTLMYPPDRFGPDGKVGTSKSSIWDRNFNTLSDNIRAKYGAEIAALSRAAAEGVEGAAAQLEATRKRMDDETSQMMESRFGPRPVDTTELISKIDSDAQQAQGYWNLYRIVKTPESQAALRAKGVDVPTYLNEVKRKADEEAVAFNAARGR